ncbi:MAG TPA: serine--tRNA ligase [Verrucomicrobiales bacterium]|nr:serine--tRNA ligase [Roseibacillus sp.]HCQ32166.1 serine--tRNA ligase [Verrucomicrobiales bacterium]
MIDIRAIRDDSDTIRHRLARRHDGSADMIDEVLSCDERRRKAETAKQQLQADRKKTSKEIGALRAKGEDSSAIEARVKEIGDRIKILEEEGSTAEARQTELLLNIPNLPHENIPEGTGEEDNPELRTWGERSSIDNPLDHVALAEHHGLISFEDGVRIAGSGFPVFRGEGARLQRALIQYLLDLQTKAHGYEEVGVPYLARRECGIGTGQLPKFAEEVYPTENGELFLIPTAEVPVTNLYRDTLLQEKDLPVKMTAHTPCWRREAGSAGRDTRGIIRVHQFDKVELVQIVHPDESFAALEELTGHAESVLQSLNLHYRVIELCGGDIGFGAARTYDIEVWAPGHGKYLEVSSCSNFTDYQARRMKLRFKDEEGKNRLCHTLNGSGTALPRLYVALLEQNQQADGSVKIPEALAPYFGADRIG